MIEHIFGADLLDTSGPIVTDVNGPDRPRGRVQMRHGRGGVDQATQAAVDMVLEYGDRGRQNHVRRVSRRIVRVVVCPIDLHQPAPVVVLIHILAVAKEPA